MFKVPSTLEKISTIHVKCLRLAIDTSELNNEEMAGVMLHAGKTGWLLFADREVELDDADLPPIPTTKTRRSPSARLRGVLYRLWDKTKKDKTFDQYYEEMMDKLIEHYKGKINEP